MGVSGAGKSAKSVDATPAAVGNQGRAIAVKAWRKPSTGRGSTLILEYCFSGVEMTTFF